MPISKQGKLYFTDEQYRIARGASALEYAKAAGYSLVPEGRLFHLREHDSMVFTQEGAWFWNAKDVRGRAIEFILHYEHRGLVAAVLLLAGGDTPGAPPVYQATSTTVEKKPFELPRRAGHFRRLFAYLCDTRQLDGELVQELVHQHRIYEGVHDYQKEGETIALHNAVFVGFDTQGQPRSAFQRGLNSMAKAYKGDVPGSVKRIPFCVPGTSPPVEVAVFEAAIDAISHATLAKKRTGDYRDIDRIVLGGISWDGLLWYLQHYPTVKTIRLCLDSDEAGQAGVEAIQKLLADGQYTETAGYQVTVEAVPQGKDWNEFLIAAHR